jgi:hypothetical protein
LRLTTLKDRYAVPSSQTISAGLQPIP